MKKDLYKIELKLGEERYSSEGKTMLEALQGLEKPQDIMLKGVITLSYKDRKKELLAFPRILRRMFYPKPIYQEIQAKRLTTALG